MSHILQGPHPHRKRPVIYEKRQENTRRTRKIRNLKLCVPQHRGPGLGGLTKFHSDRKEGPPYDALRPLVDIAMGNELTRSLMKEFFEGKSENYGTNGVDSDLGGPSSNCHF